MSKYLSGYMDLGVLGQAKVAIFPNDYKKKDNDPTHNVVVSTEDGKSRVVGRLWKHEKKETTEDEEGDV